jgi:hypothetical protein
MPKILRGHGLVTAANSFSTWTAERWSDVDPRWMEAARGPWPERVVRIPLHACARQYFDEHP